MNEDQSEEYNDYSNDYSTEYEDDSYEYSSDDLSGSETEDSYTVTNQTDSESRRPLDGGSNGGSCVTEGESASSSESVDDSEDIDGEISEASKKARGHSNGEQLEDDVGNTAMSTEGTTSGEGSTLPEELGLVYTPINRTKSYDSYFHY